MVSLAKPDTAHLLMFGVIFCLYVIYSVWFTETKTEISEDSVNENGNRTKKLRKTEMKRKWKNLKRKLINLAISVSFPLYFRSTIVVM